jgi:hypothetical protein
MSKNIDEEDDSEYITEFESDSFDSESSFSDEISEDQFEDIKNNIDFYSPMRQAEEVKTLINNSCIT